MQNLRAIRTRITGLRKTAQITRAMKMVSAVKLRRIQSQLLDSGPYLTATATMIRRLTQQAKLPPGAEAWLASPSQRTLLVVISADRGLCGNLNLNVLRMARECLQQILEDPQATVGLYLIGRKAADYCRARTSQYGNRVAIIRTIDAAGADPNELCREWANAYRQGEYGAVRMVYTHFNSALSFQAATRSLLPLHFDDPPPDEESDLETMLIEPNVGQILDYLAPRYLHSSVRRLLLSAIVAEHSSRMNIMEQASKKACEMIDQQQLFFNKARQMGIDRELADIIAGVEASA
ncbi:MAG: ATP synthase F1 subunit gamma [Kiritimatiellia bacterium]|jgi:F-type H+-transporting ATPase subunit gamma